MTVPEFSSHRSALPTGESRSIDAHFSNGRNTSTSPSSATKSRRVLPHTKSVVVLPPPTLNVYRKIAIIRSAHDSLAYEDHVSGQVQTVSVRELGDALIFKSHHDEYEQDPKGQDISLPQVEDNIFSPAVGSRSTDDGAGARSTVKKRKQDIPVPKIRVVSEYDRLITANYNLPRPFVRAAYDPTPANWKSDSVDYVLDREDDAWLQSWNLHHHRRQLEACRQANQATSPVPVPVPVAASESKLHNHQADINAQDGNHEVILRSSPFVVLSDHVFELLIDILEKETGFGVIPTITQAEVFYRDQFPYLFSIFPRGQMVTQPIADNSSKSTFPAGAPCIRQVVDDVVSYTSLIALPSRSLLQLYMSSTCLRCCYQLLRSLSIRLELISAISSTIIGCKSEES
jgi:hypothetical protein